MAAQTSHSFLVGVTTAFCAALLFAAAPAGASSDELDFMTEAMQRAQFTDFKFEFQPPAKGSPGSVAGAFVDANPFLATLPGEGIGQALVTLAPCAINQPHVHPRGTEVAHVVEGKGLLFGFREENTGRFISSRVNKGESFVFPQGLMHFTQNFGCQEAQFIASFPTRDPGTVTIASNFFALPNEAIRATLGLSEDEFKKVQQAALATANPSIDPVCARRCGIKY